MGRQAQKRPVNRLPPERRISDIMAAARAVFTEKGYDDALISDIALRAGVVEGSIYRFFANKRELLVRVVENWFEDLLSESREQFGAVSGVRQQIRFLIHQHLMSIRRDPALARLMFLEIRPSPDYRESRLFELNRAYTGRLVEVVRAGIASGALRPDVSPTLVRELVFGCIEHRTWAFLRNEGEFDAKETAEAITRLVFDGIAASVGPAADAETLMDRLEAATARLEAIAPTPAKARRGRSHAPEK